MKLNRKNTINTGIFFILLLLINLVSQTLFFRVDLTKNHIYTLSNASEKAVSHLNDPLTMRFFISENLPQPYNNLEQEIRDLMEEYVSCGNRNLNYDIEIIDSEGLNTDTNGTALTEKAESYGVHPVSMQSVSNNEMSLVSVYMGMVALQGDMSERIDNLGIQSNLEYEITGIINKISEKTNAILSLDEDILVKLVFSSSMNKLGEGLSDYPEQIKSGVDELQSRFYQKLSYQYIDPSREQADFERYGLNSMKLGKEDDETLYAALIVEKGDDFKKVELIKRGLLGNTIVDPDTLKEKIQQLADGMLGIQKTIYYLSDHGALSLYGGNYGQQAGLQNFYRLVSSEYSLTPTTMDTMPSGGTLIIAGVSEEFTDYELFQIDQFLMNGGSLALFLDPFKEEGGQPYYGAPSYTPINTGLEKLLEQYGVKLHQSYLMDEHSYISRRQGGNGSYTEQQLYNAPLISSDNINRKEAIMNNLNELIMLNAAPLEVLSSDNSEGVVTLFSSSPESWEMGENINLIPGMITPPAKDSMKQYPLALYMGGELTSYFKDKEIPLKPSDADKEEGIMFKGMKTVEENAIQSGTEGQIFLVGCSSILKDNVLDESGQSSNALFILNGIDKISGKEENAVMRSKGQSYNPIDPGLSPSIKTLIQILNIIILPVLVIIAGLMVWLKWMNRKKKIELIFSKEQNA